MVIRCEVCSKEIIVGSNSNNIKYIRCKDNRCRIDERMEIKLQAPVGLRNIEKR